MKNAMQLKAIIKNVAKDKKISAQLVLQNFILGINRTIQEDHANSKKQRYHDSSLGQLQKRL